MRKTSIPLRNPIAVGIALHQQRITPEQALKTVTQFEDGLHQLFRYLEVTRKTETMERFIETLTLSDEFVRKHLAKRA